MAQLLLQTASRKKIIDSYRIRILSCVGKEYEDYPPKHESVKDKTYKLYFHYCGGTRGANEYI